jgi:CheY-like chemotaxis protein
MDLSFMVIDDTELDHFIARKMIHHADKRFEVKPFYEALSAIDYIKSAEGLSANTYTMVLLDIYMPIMTGYEFLEAFEELDVAIREKYYIVVLTSSHEPADLNRMSSYKSAKEMLSKPLVAEDLSVVIRRMMEEKGIKMR